MSGMQLLTHNVLNSLMDQMVGSPYTSDYGYGLHPHQFLEAPRPQWARSLLNHDHHHQVARRDKQPGPISTIGKDGFQVCMDVTQFKPNELQVKVVDKCITVEGKHEEREDDHGYISRHFVRRYKLPDGYDADKVLSTLSSDGVLTVSVPKPQLQDKQGGRVIQIQQTGPAHLNVKSNHSHEKELKNGSTNGSGNGTTEEKK